MRVNIELDSYRDGLDFLKDFEELFLAELRIFVEIKDRKVPLRFVDSAEVIKEVDGRTRASFQLEGIE